MTKMERDRMLIKFLRIALVLLLVLTAAVPALAAEVPDESGDAEHGLSLILFWREGCPHCEAELKFLKGLKERYPDLAVKTFEVSKSPENARALEKLMHKMNSPRVAVPATIVGNAVFLGYSEDIGNQIEQQVRYIKKEVDSAETDTIVLPFFGEVKPSDFSLPVFTLIIAGLDSFNPCALYILLFLLSLLMHAKSRMRMAVVGGTFVFISGLVYFLFMAAWLNLFFLMGRMNLITTVAGLVALLVGALNIKEFFAFKKGVSLTLSNDASAKLIKRMRGLLNAHSMSSMLMGTVILAVAANAYELLCTAGFPMVYTRVLTLNELSRFSYYMYLLFYNVVYVIPLLIVVILFTVTLGARKLTEYQGRVLKLLSGSMMLTLGFVLVLKPGLLNNVIAATGMLLFSLLAAWLLSLFHPGD